MPERPGSPVTRVIGLAAGPVLFVAALAAPMPADMSEPAAAVVALVVWMVAWWVTQVVPIAVTSLLPLVVLPLADVMGMGDAAASYADPVIFLMLGGFIIAAAIGSTACTVASPSASWRLWVSARAGCYWA